LCQARAYKLHVTNLHVIKTILKPIKIIALALGALLLASCGQAQADALVEALKPTPTLRPIATPVVPAGWKTHSSAVNGFSIAYPADWQASEQNLIVEFGTAELIATQRAQGAALVITTAPQQDAISLQEIWNSVKQGIGQNSPTEPITTTLGGEEALRSEISNTDHGLRGTMYITRRGLTYFLVVAYTLKQSDPAQYDATFKDMIASFRFTK